MALDFRYRFVDFGTMFTAADGVRSAEQGAVDPCALFSNELVTDVGGTCCNGNEPLAVFDHHFTREAQFPAASAAVLHKAKLIRSRFAGQQDGIFWLVTHKQPDFDAFCSMYLARWILEDPATIVDWTACGLDPDGWKDPGDRQRFDWFHPDLHAVTAEQRWPLLMASYASIVDNGQHFPCPRNRALHSILYAALQRGRDYLSESGGAIELFNEIKTAIRDKKRNPIFDSVLEDSHEFAPELSMLDREIEAYRRDVRRARRSIVYLQRSPGPVATLFDRLKAIPLLDASGAISPEQLLSDETRIATDGICLRDPECLLFKEWARLDLENSSLGRGFEFTAVAYSNGRPEGSQNRTDYFFAIDPERANGRHLYRVWARLQAAEVAALRGQQVSEKPARRGFEGRAGILAKYFADPWFDGQNYFCTIVATPNHGTQIAPPGTDGGLSDDAIAEVVRSEVEYSIYQAAQGAEIASVTVRDLSATRNTADIGPRRYNIAQLQKIDPPAERRFRFAGIPLREGVPISLAGRNSLAEQIGETLWQVLYPDLHGAKPHDFTQRHLVVAPLCVGVWGDRGVAIAYKPMPQAASPNGKTLDDDGGIERGFTSIVSLACKIDELIAKSDDLAKLSPDTTSPQSDNPELSKLAINIANEGENLARDAARIKHNLTLPHSDLLRRFYDATGIDELLNTLRDLNQNAAEYLRREKMADQARKTSESTETVAEVQSKLEWVEIFIVGVYAVETMELFSKHLVGENNAGATLAMLFSLPAFLLFTAWILQPWKRKPAERLGGFERPAWILGIVLTACFLAFLWACHLYINGLLPPAAGK